MNKKEKRIWDELTALVNYGQLALLFHQNMELSSIQIYRCVEHISGNSISRYNSPIETPVIKYYLVYTDPLSQIIFLNRMSSMTKINSDTIIVKYLFKVYDIAETSYQHSDRHLYTGKIYSLKNPYLRGEKPHTHIMHALDLLKPQIVTVSLHSQSLYEVTFLPRLRRLETIVKLLTPTTTDY